VTQKHRQWLAAALFLLPDGAGLLLFVAVPMVLALAMGFFSVNEFGSVSFAGLQNYQAMFRDPLFYKSLQVTVTYTVVFVPSLFVVSLALAHLIQQRVPLVGLWRMLLFLPNFVSVVVVALMFQYVLGQRTGILDQLIAPLGGANISWLGDPRYALWTVIAISVWIYMGYYMIIFLAALEDVPREYYDAARIDGAGFWGRFVHVTWPLIRPTSFFVLLLATIGSRRPVGRPTRPRWASSTSISRRSSTGTSATRRQWRRSSSRSCCCGRSSFSH
jgi:multiple sugar transport system permease protein